MPEEIHANLTWADLEAFGHRLHFNSALDFVCNGVAAYVVMKHSTNSMGYYKYYILLSILTSGVMDFHISFIFGAFPTFPVPGFCPVGIAKYWGWFWGEAIQYLLIHITLPCTGLSLVASTLYQYYNVQGKTEFFKTRKCAVIITSSFFIYPSPAICLYLITVIYSPREEVLAFVEEAAPHMHQLFVHGPCNAILFTIYTKIYLIVCLILIIAVLASLLTITYKIRNKLNEHQHSMSAKTLKAHRQLLMSLILQSTVPTMFVFIPIIALFVSVAVETQYAAWFSPYAMQLYALHSCANSLTILFVITPYRKALKGYFTKLVKLPKSTSTAVVTSVF